MKMTKKVLSILLSLMLLLGAVAVGGMSVSAEGEAAYDSAAPRESYICQYKLGDTYGDHWSGGHILIEYLGYTTTLGRVNPDPTPSTLIPYDPTVPDSMDTGYILFPAMCDDPYGYDIEVSWVSGGYDDDEVIFDLSFPDGSNLHVEKPVPGCLGTYHVETTPGESTDYEVFKVAAMDSLLDGWTGGAVEIYQEGCSEPFTRVVNNDGEARTENDILLPSGYTYEFRWMKDRNNSECSVEVTDDKGNTCSAENPDAGLLWSFYVPYKTGNRLYYGTYPQSKVTDETTLNVLNALAPENFDDWTSYGYYSGTGMAFDGQMKSGDFMRYYDAVLDGVKYRAVLFMSYRPYATDYTCSANYSFQDENGYNTNTVYWFRFEPIEWRVLDPDEGFIVCNSAIDSQAYNNYIIENGTDGYGKTAYWGNSAQTYYANNYAESSIRAWLNDDFINTAFSASQQENIKKTALNNDAYSESYSQYNSAQTNDKIFLLSYTEATNSAYGFDAEASNYDTARWLKGSDYAVCQELRVYNSSDSEYDGNAWWWLRSPGNGSYYACYVSGGGPAYHSSYVNGTENGVVPALKLQDLKPDPTGAPLTIDPGMTVTVTPQNPASDGTFTLTVNLPDDATGNVIIRFNEVDLLGYIKLAEGNSQQFNCLQSGRYSGTAKYMPDDSSNYKEVTVEFSFNVSAAAPNMTLTAEDITYGETATVTANLPRDTMWGSVTFRLDGADTGKTVYVSQGKAVCTFAGLNAGEHTVEAVFANDDKYADETKTVTFNVEQKELTITANDQTYPFNDQIQGEGDTAYEDPAEIAEKVTADGLVSGDTLESIILDGQAKDIDEYEGAIVPSSAVIKNSGGQDVTSNYNITYTAGKLTITSVNAPLTINYVYADGTEAAETYTDSVEIFKDYSVTSPEITGYTPDKETVEGTMENIDGVTETVTYMVNTYTATLLVEGEVYEEIPFTYGQKSITLPDVPKKEGHTGAWESYSLGAEDIEISAIYKVNTYTAQYIVDGEGFAQFDVEFGQAVTRPRTPQKDGYTFKWIDEIPETMPAEDVTINGEFTPIEYTATFVDENGETVEKVKFTVEDESITEPAVPEKTNYTGKWEEYTLGTADITIKPVYTLGGETTVKAVDTGSEVTSDYKETKEYNFETEYLPEGATTHVFVNGEDKGEGTSVTFEEPTEDYTVECKAFDADGNEIASSGEIKVKVKNSFFDRLKWFFNNFWANILKTFIDALIAAC